MSKIKGLLSAIKGNQESSLVMLPYNKQLQGYQRTIKKIIQAYNKSFVQPYSVFCSQTSQLNKNLITSLKSTSNKPQFYLFTAQIFVDLQKNYRNTNQQIKDYSEQGLKLIETECEKLKITLNILHEKLKQHEKKEDRLNQEVREYTNYHKNLSQAIDSYKTSLQDVKLIYNIEQKIKRYKNSESFYHGILQTLKKINQMIENLSSVRQELKVILEEFKEKSLQFARSAWLEIIKIPYNIMKCFINGNRLVQKSLKQRVKLLQQKDNRIIFQKFRLPYPSPEHFDCQNQHNQNSLLPFSILNLRFLKTQHFGHSKRFFLEYYCSTRQDISQKQNIIEKLKVYFQSLGNNLERMFVTESKEVKDMLTQKTIRPILDGFCSGNPPTGPEDKPSMVLEKLHPIQKSISSIVQFLEDEKNLFRNMTKLYSQQIKQIVQELEDQSKQLNLFKQEMKSKLYSLFQGKKQFKKDLETLKSGEMKGILLSEKQIKDSKEEIVKKSQEIVQMVNVFAQKFKSINSKVKSSVFSFLEDYVKQINYEKQIYEKQKDQLSKQMNHLFDSSITSSNEQKNQKCWIFENGFFKFIVKENTKIKFDSQIDKVNSFTKLKKPVGLEQKSSDSGNQRSSPLQSPRQMQNSQNSERTSSQISKDEIKSVLTSTKPSQKRLQKKQSVFKSLFGKNYEQFFQQKVKMEEGQKYIGHFPCGLADKIIISGRLYISSHRLFFHSRFNASNIFFGETKLEIPKSDIKKIQKRYNAIIFDNSISITTINGQIFFTSFMSRDKAFELICETFEISQDDHIFVSEQQIEEVGQGSTEINVNLQQEDDLADDQIQSRSKMIDDLIESNQKQDEKAYSIGYKPISDFAITFPGINAAKFFKIFDSGQEFIYKSKTYESFWHYFKVEVHKNFDLQISPWQPNVLEYINPSNIKSTAPLKFTRRIQAKIPIPANSIPFMPKFLESVQNATLYFHSKNKYVTINQCANSKAPYTDCFYMIFKRIIEKTAQDTITIKNSYKMVFIKSPLVKKMIESRTHEQTIQNYASYRQQCTKYLKTLEQSINRRHNKPMNKAQSSQNNELQNIILQEQNGKKITELEEQNQKINKQLQRTKQEGSNLKKALVFSVIVNLLLIVIIMLGWQTAPDQINKLNLQTKTEPL